MSQPPLYPGTWQWCKTGDTAVTFSWRLVVTDAVINICESNGRICSRRGQLSTPAHCIKEYHKPVESSSEFPHPQILWKFRATEVGAGSPDFPSSCIPLLKESDKFFLQPRWIAGTYPWVGLEKSQLQHFDFRSGRWQTHDQIDTPGSPHPPALWETPDITV